MPDYRRGEIYYVAPSYAETGTEIWSGRPAVIVSSDELNACRNCVEMVYLTTRPKEDSPFHVTVHATGKQSTALCEQISSVDKSRLSAQYVRCTPKEMEAIDKALLASLGLDAPRVPATIDLDKMRLLAERDIYKNLYEKMLDRLSGVAAGA